MGGCGKGLQGFCYDHFLDFFCGLFFFHFSSPQGIFIKDSNSLAYYNMTSGSLIHLALKERGGRKK